MLSLTEPGLYQGQQPWIVVQNLADVDWPDGEKSGKYNKNTNGRRNPRTGTFACAPLLPALVDRYRPRGRRWKRSPPARKLPTRRRLLTRRAGCWRRARPTSLTWRRTARPRARSRRAKATRSTSDGMTRASSSRCSVSCATFRVLSGRRKRERGKVAVTEAARF